MYSTNEKPRVVSLFSGAGCFDLGFETAGFQTILSTDIDYDCCQTISLNKKHNIVNAPIESISDSIRKLAKVRTKELELLIGGPPCQPYSKSANGSMGGSPLGFEDERANTVREYFKAVSNLLPKVFVIENVPQFITGQNQKIKDYILRSVSRINSRHGTNYQLSFCKINAAWYGVPQLRERIFIIGVRNGITFEMPELRHLDRGDSELGILPYRTAWDSLGNSENKYDNTKDSLAGKWGKLLKTIPPGQNYLWHTERGGGRNIFEWRSRYWNFLLKLHPMLPSWTIAAQPGQFTGPFHWENRKLNTRELQKLQTIQESYNFYGGQTSVRRQIGNGVPSAIGELLGKEIRRQVFNERVSSANLKLIPQQRKTTKHINKLIRDNQSKHQVVVPQLKENVE